MLSPPWVILGGGGEGIGVFQYIGFVFLVLAGQKMDLKDINFCHTTKAVSVYCDAIQPV